MTTLKDLLQQGAAIRTRKRELRDTKRALRETEKLPHATAAELNTLAKRIEEELLWRSTAVVTLFDQQTCTCCHSVATTVIGVMIEQEHTRERGTRRMLRAVSQHPTLPHRPEVWRTHVQMCYQCYSQHEEKTHHEN